MGFFSDRGASLATPDLDDVKESVRQGVSKVAGRLSNMASGVFNTLQVRSKVTTHPLFTFNNIPQVVKDETICLVIERLFP